MIMSRRSKLDVPAEFAAFIPRAEIRRRYYSNGELVQEEEFILNSITTPFSCAGKSFTRADE